jgi:hypothetical protein
MPPTRARGSIEGLYYVYGKSEQKVYGKSEQGDVEKYARLPDSVLCDHRLTVTARCVYGVLARYAYQGTTVKIGQRRIALLLGIHVETVNLALHELEDGNISRSEAEVARVECTIWGLPSLVGSSGPASKR